MRRCASGERLTDIWVSIGFVVFEIPCDYDSIWRFEFSHVAVVRLLLVSTFAMLLWYEFCACDLLKAYEMQWKCNQILILYAIYVCDWFWLENSLESAVWEQLRLLSLMRLRHERYVILIISLVLKQVVAKRIYQHFITNVDELQQEVSVAHGTFKAVL